MAVALIAVFEGYDCVPTAEGVSRAITRTVVSSALAILALDFVMTSFMFRVDDESYHARPVGRVFVAIGIAALLFLALKVGNFGVRHPVALYPSAHFDNIGGLKVRPW